MLGKAGPLPCTPVGIIELLRRSRRADRRRRGGRRRPRHHRRPAARSAAHPPQRERHRDAVPHRHPGPGRRTCARPTSSSPPPACPGSSPRDMVKPGAAVLDVGVSRVDGKIAGDVAAEVAEVAGWVSPNPGGVGPMTRAMLLTNSSSSRRPKRAAAPRASAWIIVAHLRAVPAPDATLVGHPSPRVRAEPVDPAAAVGPGVASTRRRSAAWPAARSTRNSGAAREQSAARSPCVLAAAGAARSCRVGRLADRRARSSAGSASRGRPAAPGARRPRRRGDRGPHRFLVAFLPRAAPRRQAPQNAGPLGASTILLRRNLYGGGAEAVPVRRRRPRRSRAAMLVAPKLWPAARASCSLNDDGIGQGEHVGGQGGDAPR